VRALPVTLLLRRETFLARLLCRGDIASLTLAPDGGVQFARRDGSSSTGHAAADTLVSPWLIVLRLRLDEGGSASLVLPVAALGADGHRRLRIWLRWRANAAV